MRVKKSAPAHCGKQGLVEQVDGKVYFVHVSTIEFGENQTFTHKNEQCAFGIKSAEHDFGPDFD